jgi:hypothetical protein
MAWQKICHYHIVGRIDLKSFGQRGAMKQHVCRGISTNNRLENDIRKLREKLSEISDWRFTESQFPDGNKIHFYQIPLKLCYAVTAQKAQGQTLSKVAVSIMDEAFAHGAFYVALLHVGRMSDLMLFGTFHSR